MALSLGPLAPFLWGTALQQYRFPTPTPIPTPHSWFNPWPHARRHLLGSHWLLPSLHGNLAGAKPRSALGAG